MIRTLAITGGTGFIGRHLIQSATQHGFKVRALTRHQQPPLTDVTWVKGDITTPEAVRTLLTGADAVIHLAGAVRGVTDRDFEATNVCGVATLLSEMRTAAEGAPLLLISSLAARHPQLSSYAHSKFEAERLLKEHTGIQWTILRPPAVYGPGDKELLPLFSAMQKGLGAHPNHDGRFSMIYVSDLVAAIMAWVSAPGNAMTLELHDGHPNGYDWEEILAIVSTALNRRIWPLPLAKSLMQVPAAWNTVCGRWFAPPMLTLGKIRELYYDNWVCCNEAITRQLNWSPTVDLHEGITRLFAEPA